MRNPGLTFLLIFIALQFYSCTKTEVENPDLTIIISGKINNYVDSLKPSMAINRVGLDQEKIFPTIDESGNFRFEFNAPVPLDAFFISDPFFIMVAKPGDSINLEINQGDTVIFSGDRSQENRFAYDLSDKWQEKRKEFGNLQEYISVMNQDQFIAKLDSIKSEIKRFTEGYIVKNNISDPYLSRWIRTYTMEYYYNNLSYYIFPNRDKDVDKIQSLLTKRLPLKTEDLYSAYNISSYVNYYNYAVIGREIMLKSDSINDTDSAHMHTVFAMENDTLMRQLLIAENLVGDLEKFRIEKYERFVDIIDSLITISYIRDSLKSKYNIAVQSLKESENTKGDLFLGDNFSSTSLLDSVINANAGKVVYIDVWATWCGPCISEFKNSADFKSTFKDDPITYIYICAQSRDTTVWKAMVNKFRLKGINLYLNKEQFNEFDEKYDVIGFPTYMIFDKNGELVENGIMWRPSFPQTLKKIKELL